MATFTWIPDYDGTQGDREPRIKGVRYGDGYEARWHDGLNPLAEVWPVSFLNRTTTEADEIDNFLKARGGVESFLWTPPRSSTEIRVICKRWGRVPVRGNLDSIRATFEQVFDNG